ncbi:hypothetical protein PsorP6_002540 [Peronosclerospora sorghi]|uniref:Uncharacterized protein n=1 Tax=Peronosclerospora sorghi TaxID=230839 RepID=A0ACC0WYP2_9STRA|nr:hypothetical protein PsorP6_002540 [Peronosclerospora sorghi]
MKKPVLLRFERLSACTPSSDDDDGSQFNGQQSSSTNAASDASHNPSPKAPQGDETDPTSKVQRANSVPQKDQKLPKATRGAFWRATGAKDSVPTQMAGPNGVNGGSERMAVSHGQRRVLGNKDDQVSPRDATPANGSKDRFASPLGTHEYQVYWETGSLGLFFGENRATNLPVVTRSTPSANPVVRRAVAVNDTLVSANGIKSVDYTFEAFFGRLQQMSKPVRLVFRRRQPTDPAVVIKQGDQQQRQQQEQMLPNVQQRQQTRELEQKRELQKIRDKQEREQEQHLTEQKQQREQQIREQKQREQHIREQKQREQLREQQREQQREQREQLQLEEQQREQQQREKLQREQQQREKLQRDQQQQREQQQRMQQQRELQHREQQQRKQHDELSREETDHRSRIPSVKSDKSLTSSILPKDNWTPDTSSIVKDATAPLSCPPIADVRSDDNGNYQECSQSDSSHANSSTPNSPVASKNCATPQQHFTNDTSSTNLKMSPKSGVSPTARSFGKFGNSPKVSSKIGSSPKVLSSPLISPIAPSVSTENADAASDTANTSALMVSDEASPTEAEKDVVYSLKENPFEKEHGRRSRNSSEEQRHIQESATSFREGFFSPSSSTELSPREPLDSLEHLPSPEILKVESVKVDVDAVAFSSTAGSDLQNRELAEKAQALDEIKNVEQAELVAASLIDDVMTAGAVVADQPDLDEEVELAQDAEMNMPSIPLNLAEDSAKIVANEGIVADVEVSIAVEETDLEVAEGSASDPWDLEPEFEGQKTQDQSRNATSSHDELSCSKGNFVDSSDPTEEFSNDSDISGDIDVENDILMRDVHKDKIESANVPKPSKASLHANLAKYKKKGKTARGITKLPALSEDDALTVPLVAPNAVNTTVQVRGRSKPKWTMADTPDSRTFLIKWKENRSIGLQLREVRFAKGIYPLVTDVCQEPCCELLRHICVGDVIIEINGRNTSTMGVKKTVNFLKTCTKTTLMKIRHGPAYTNQRVSATV